ncbi:MAG: CBS domain-containing protein [Paracoccaceae bacterium]
MLIRDILANKPSSEIYAVSIKDTVSTAAEMLSAKRIGAVLVRDDSLALKGILSERDIVREIGKRGVDCMEDCVADIMTKSVKSCAMGDTPQAVMKMMTDGRFRHMPVMEGDDLVGVISIGDAVAARITEIKLDNDAMMEMIAGNA